MTRLPMQAWPGGVWCITVLRCNEGSRAAMTKTKLTPTIVDQICENLSGRIVSGALPAGSRLRQEEIASEFASSHVPVREAFRRLEADGLVVALPRRGVRVALPDPVAHFETLEMRAVLEGLALLHAVPHHSPKTLAAVAEADAACERAMDGESWEEANRQFHASLIAPCPLPTLLQSVQRLQRVSALSARALGGRASGSFPRSDRDHKSILRALQAGDSTLCADLLTRHIRRGHLPQTTSRSAEPAAVWTRNR